MSYYFREIQFIKYTWHSYNYMGCRVIAIVLVFNYLEALQFLYYNDVYGIIES
jgi:hypothetical protein